MTQENLESEKVRLDRAKKNLVIVGILSVIMFFAGLTSAYIVSMGDSFWMKTDLPIAFWISTCLIIVSSITMQMAIFAVRKKNYKLLKIMVVLTFLLGLSFVYTQFKGYGQLVENGVTFNQEFFVDDGYYGFNEKLRLGYFDLKYDNDFISSDGYDFFLNGKILSPGHLKEVRDFMGQFADPKITMWEGMTASSIPENKFKIDKNYKVKGHEHLSLTYKLSPVYLINGKLCKSDSSEFLPSDKFRLVNLANNIRDGRGDFYVKGKMGKDFHVYFNPKRITTVDGKVIKNEETRELEYANRRLKYKGINAYLSEYDFHSAMESADTSSSYLFIITFAHLMHIMITLFYLFRIVIRSFSGKINSDNSIGLTTGAIFWHFLGALWIYLLLFLLFIH